MAEVTMRAGLDAGFDEVMARQDMRDGNDRSALFDAIRTSSQIAHRPQTRPPLTRQSFDSGCVGCGGAQPSIGAIADRLDLQAGPTPAGRPRATDPYGGPRVVDAVSQGFEGRLANRGDTAAAGDFGGLSWTLARAQALAAERHLHLFAYGTVETLQTQTRPAKEVWLLLGDGIGGTVITPPGGGPGLPDAGTAEPARMAPKGAQLSLTFLILQDRWCGVADDCLGGYPIAFELRGTRIVDWQDAAEDVPMSAESPLGPGFVRTTVRFDFQWRSGAIRRVGGVTDLAVVVRLPMVGKELGLGGSDTHSEVSVWAQSYVQAFPMASGPAALFHRGHVGGTNYCAQLAEAARIALSQTLVLPLTVGPSNPLNINFALWRRPAADIFWHATGNAELPDRLFVLANLLEPFERTETQLICEDGLTNVPTPY